MATQTYNSGFLRLVDGTTAWGTVADVYAVLVSSAYTFSRAHSTYADVSTHVIVDVDYAPQDVPATGSPGRTVTLATNDVLFNCDDVTFGAEVTIDASAGGIIFLLGAEATPGASDPLLFYWGLPNPASSTAGTFTVRVPNGIIRITDAV
jgi:hypothetical protein